MASLKKYLRFLPLLLLPFLNRARGSDFFHLISSSSITRLLTTLLMAVIGAISIGFSPTVLLILWVGIFLWAVFGWGKYFSAFHGRDNPQESEIKWIDAIGYKLFPVDNKESTNRLRGMVCMSLRGSVFSLPLFIALSAYITPYIMLSWFLMFLQGPIYYSARIVKEKFSVLYAEIMMGFLFSLIFYCIKGLICLSQF